jgi:hypothetical protein
MFDAKMLRVATCYPWFLQMVVIGTRGRLELGKTYLLAAISEYWDLDQTEQYDRSPLWILPTEYFSGTSYLSRKYT